MTKELEISLLREVAEKLGPDSYLGPDPYLGPVLAAEIDQIAADIRNDVIPAGLISRAKEHANILRVQGAQIDAARETLACLSRSAGNALDRATAFRDEADTLMRRARGLADNLNPHSS